MSVDTDFDPLLVPSYPQVRIVLAAIESGDYSATVDGEQVGEYDSPAAARDAAITRTATLAESRPLEAIRALGVDPDGDEFELVVRASGEVVDLAGVSSRGRRGGSGGLRRMPAWAVVTAAGSALVLVFVGMFAVLLIGGGSSSPAAAPTHATSSRAPLPTATQLPVQAPAGWSSVASWSVPAGASASGASGASVWQHRVFAAGKGGTAVAAYDVKSGREWWSAKVDGQVSVGPEVTNVDGRVLVVAASSTQLFAWDPQSGKRIGHWSIPTGGQVQITEAGPVVSSDGQHAEIVVDGELVSRVLPAGARPVQPSPGGVLIAAGDPGQVWSVGDDHVAGSAFGLVAPRGYSFSSVVGSTSSLLIAGYVKDGDKAAQRVVLRGFKLGTWKPVWTSQPAPVVTDTGLGGLPLRASSDGSWGIYGRTAVDLRSGVLHGLPEDWQTSVVGDSVGFGTTGGVIRAVVKSGLTRAVGQAPADGVGATGSEGGPVAAGDGVAFVLATDGQRSALYAVKTSSADATRPTPSPSSTPSKTSGTSASRTSAPKKSTAPRSTKKPVPHKSASKKPVATKKPSSKPRSTKK